MVLNKNNKDQIHAMLKIKLAIDFMKNMDFIKKNSYKTTKDLFYYMELAEIKTQIRFEDIRVLLRAIQAEQLTLLPEISEQIKDNIMKLLLFTLSIRDCRLLKKNYFLKYLVKFILRIQEQNCYQILKI